MSLNDQSLINIETRSIAVFVLQGYVNLSDAEITERLAVTLSRRQKFMENKKMSLNYQNNYMEGSGSATINLTNIENSSIPVFILQDY